MLKIGITGGIGSGKTTVCKIFEVLAVPVFYADDVAKALMNTDMQLTEQLLDAFGSEAFLDGELNRQYLAGLVFNNPVQLARLNALVHPAVFRAFDKWAASHSASAYVLKEAALLFESGANKLCDKSIVVTAPVELKVARVMARDHSSAADVEKRMQKQWTDEQKLALADFVITNDEVHLIVPQVLRLHETFLHLSSMAV